MSLVTAVTRSSIAAISLAILSGCAVNMKIPVKEPLVSTLAYSKNGAAAVSLAFRDAQNEADRKTVTSGTIPMHLEYQAKPLETTPWLAAQVIKEMTARGLPVTLAGSGQAGATIVIKRMHIENHRANGFSPFVTFTSLSAELETPAGPKRISAWIKRAKVPVWSFDEVIDPTFNDPLAILSKELAAKLNQHLFKQVASTDDVNALIAKINKDATTRADAYLDVYQLGFSNNPAVIPELVKLSTSPSEYVRLAALSSLGIVKATGQMNFLVERYESKTGIWQDRGMALKAIGDLDTAESRAYLQKQAALFEKSSDKEATWTKQIIQLYL